MSEFSAQAETKDMKSARTRLVVSRRGDFKGGREIEIPTTFDGSLVTFCPHRKLLARGRNILFTFSLATGSDGRPQAAPTTEHSSQIPDRADHFVPPNNPAKSHKSRQY